MLTVILGHFEDTVHVSADAIKLTRRVPTVGVGRADAGSVVSCYLLVYPHLLLSRVAETQSDTVASGVDRQYGWTHNKLARLRDIQ